MPIHIGKQIGAGGEGTVHEVVGRDDLVAKVFHNPPRDLHIETKLAAMIRSKARQGPSAIDGFHVPVAWPQQMLRFPDGRIGYTMHYARGTQPLFLVYDPMEVAIRRWNIDAVFLRRVAHNVAAQVSAIHAAGYVIGDLNESNIHVTSRGLVTFIDTDSFQVTEDGRRYPCLVVKPQYVAPELVGKDLGSVERDRAHDHFALAVIVFQLLMGGRHPYAGVWPSGAGDPPPAEEWIRRGLFAYSGSCYVDGRRIEPPPNAPRYDRLDPRLRDYFERCFVLGHRDPGQRPSAREWAKLLRNLLEGQRQPVLDKPKIVSVANPNAGTSARLIFERLRAVADDQIAGYDYQKRLSGRIWSEAPPPTRVASRRTQYTFTGLARQSTYVFRVRAYNGSGTGAWSDDSPEQFIPAARTPPPTKLALTRGDGSCRATWANVRGATGYDLHWRQRGAWTHVPNVVSPRTIAPVVDSEFVELQVRAQNSTGASAWSPIVRVPPLAPAPPPPPLPLPKWMKLIRFGVVLLAVVASIVIGVSVGVPGRLGREGQGSTPFRERTGSTAPRENQGGTSLRGDVGLAPGDNGGTASVDDTDSAPSPRENGGLTSPAEPEPRVTDLTFPLIESLERSAPSAYRTNADSVTWRIAFTEAMSNVDKADFTIIGIRPWSLTVTKVNDSGSVYDITLNSHALADHNGTVALALSPSRTIEDLAGNDLVNRSLSGEVEFVIDNTAPTVTIDGVPATDSGSFMATFTFSEEVTGFTASDVRVTNATASALTEVHAGREWHVRITPTGNHGDGEAIPFGIEDHYYSVSLPADWVTDLAGNGNTAWTTRSGSYGSDVTAPQLLSIVRKTPSTSPAQAASVTWRVTFTEDVQHFGINSVNLLEHRSARVLRPGAQYPVRPVGGSEAVYDVTFDGLADHTGRVKLNFRVRSDDNPYSLYIQDKAARALLCCETIGADERTFDVDNVAPRVADIVRSSPGREHTNQDEVAWTVTFSEPVRNLSAGDFTVSGTDATLTVTQEGSGSRTWNVIASGGDLARLNTTIRLSFAGTRDIEDAAGNLLAAIAPTGADENTFVIDSVAPALTSIVRQPPKGSPADAETATWRLTFSEHMRGIDATDFAVHGAKIAVVAAGSKADYDLSVSGEDVIPRSSPDQRVHQQRERHHRPCRQRPARAASTDDDRTALVSRDAPLNRELRQTMPQVAL